MRAQLINISKQPSKYGGDFYYLFFKADGKSYRSCVSPSYRNWSKWREVVDSFDGSPILLDGLKLKGNLVDADSSPVVVE